MHTSLLNHLDTTVKLTLAELHTPNNELVRLLDASLDCEPCLPISRLQPYTLPVIDFVSLAHSLLNNITIPPPNCVARTSQPSKRCG
ncbi:hypothetical protein KC325_g150 [Hortaea werneckii]|nr:hypothetical protein KC325_g150 [Hortaea werneckii]